SQRRPGQRISPPAGPAGKVPAGSGAKSRPYRPRVVRSRGWGGVEIGYQGAGSEALASPLPEATLLRLKRHAVIRQFSDGERVPRAGPVGEHVHYIRRGRVRAVLHGPGGQDKILAILDRGALF